MTEQQHPRIEPGLRVRYRSDAAGLNMLAGEVREVSGLADGMVEVVDPEQFHLGVMNAEGEGVFWSIYEPVSSGLPSPHPPTREPNDEPWIFDGTQATAHERAQMLRAVARAPRPDDALTIERGADLIDTLLDRTEHQPPTREQIAEARQVLYDYADRKIGTYAALIALRALIQNGADR